MSKAGCLVLVFKLPCTKRYLRYCWLTSFQEMASEWPRNTLASQGGTFGERLGIATITIIFGIGTKTGANRVELDVSSHRGQGLAAFEQNALKALGPEHPVTTMTAVVPLGKAPFELFDEDREVKEAVAIGLQELLDLIGAIWRLTQESELLIEGLATRRTVAGLDAFE